VVVSLGLGEICLEEGQVSICAASSVLGGAGRTLRDRDQVDFRSVVGRKLGSKVGGERRWVWFWRGRQGPHNSDMRILSSWGRLVQPELAEVEILDDVLASGGGRESTGVRSVAGDVSCLPQ